MKIAAAAYPLEWLSRWNDYVGKLRVWIRTASENGAELLVFPEYAALELASLAGEENARDRGRVIEAVSARIKDVDELHKSLAREFGVHISAGSAPVRRADGQVVNRARLFAPDGSSGLQEKLILTRGERDWGLAPGGALRVFETTLGRIGILICTDCEFPLIARAMIEGGAEILLVPSCTGTLSGYTRVRIGAMARALEGQCVTVLAPTIGDAAWLAVAERNFGAAGVFGPPDTGFSEEGVIAQGKMNTLGWVYGEVWLEAIRAVRAESTALGLQHWSEQDERLGAVETVTLGAATAEPAAAKG